MSTWIGVLVHGGGADFWDIAKVLNVHPVAPEAERVSARWALIDCEAADPEVAPKLARGLSHALRTQAIGFVAQTSADVHVIHAFEQGENVRTLSYSRDQGGWGEVSGAPQPWEPAYFFDGKAAHLDGNEWPDMLGDELSEEELARYELARARNDPSSVISMLRPSSTAPLQRLCAYLSVDPARPLGIWRRTSLLRRILGRS